MPSKEAASYSYAVFSLDVEPHQHVSVPVGVALWSSGTKWVRLRLAGEAEKLKGVDRVRDLPIVRLVQDQVLGWINTGKLPHAQAPLPPYEDGWWRHVRELLVHRVRLSEPRPIDCHDPEQELEPLYEAIVASARPAREQQTRIDGEITKCLKHLADRFRARQRIPGFRGREVPVLRAYHGSRGWVVIEGINLATSQAELLADATASKLMRLKQGVPDKCEVMVGYLASPEGLNGEKVLIDWLHQQTDAKTFDLMKERHEFLETAGKLVEKASGQAMLI